MQDGRKRKLLMICHSFPPAGGSRVQRPLKFVKYLKALGWELCVITASRASGPLDPSLLDEVPEGVKVERVMSPDPGSMDKLLSDARARGMNGFLYAALKALLRIYSAAYYRMVTVDWYEGWVPFALKAAKKAVSRGDADVIYVHGQPPSSFIVGAKLKKRTAKPLVIDYDDPWTTSVYAMRDKSRKAARSREIEREVLSSADAVISVKPDTIRDIRSAFPSMDPGKMFFLPNGYDMDDYAGLERKQGGKFTITYAGRLSDRYCYSPESFLTALGGLIFEGKLPADDVEVNFAGTVAPSYSGKLQKLVKDLGLSGVVRFRGFLGHRECMRLLLASDVLLLLMESPAGREESRLFAGSIPAKLFEYMPTGVPILGILPPGFEADLIRDTGTGLVAEANDPSSVRQALEGLYEKYRSGALKTNADRAKIEKYDRKALSGQLSGIMAALLEDRGKAIGVRE